MPTGLTESLNSNRACCCFNPCSSGWCLPASFLRLWGRLLDEVSILVLLDDAYRQLFYFSRFNAISSFNPCSSGWCLPAEEKTKFIGRSIKFQSLFFWMMPTGPLIRQCWEALSLVSILVLLDDAYRRRRKKMSLKPLKSFNPCSSGWCLPARPSYTSKSITFKSFNPCSSGWCLPAVDYPDVMESDD